jgi:hypothetical protein
VRLEEISVECYCRTWTGGAAASCPAVQTTPGDRAGRPEGQDRGRLSGLAGGPRQALPRARRPAGGRLLPALRAPRASPPSR